MGKYDKFFALAKEAGLEEVELYISENHSLNISLFHSEVEEYKDNQAAEGYTLTKSGYVLKTKKSKGEIIDSWAVVTVEMNFEE